MKPEVKRSIDRGFAYFIPFVLFLGSPVAAIAIDKSDNINHQVDSELPALPSVDALKLSKAKQKIDIFDQKVHAEIIDKGPSTIKIEDFDEINSIRNALTVLNEQGAADQRQRLRVALNKKLQDQDGSHAKGIIVLTFGLILSSLSTLAIQTIRRRKTPVLSKS